MKSIEQFYREFAEVNAFYAADEGLQRPGGMVIDREGVPTCDTEAMAQWGYQLLAQNRTPAQVLAQIRQSDEWKTKHPDDPHVPPPPPPSGVFGVIDGHWTWGGASKTPVVLHAGDVVAEWVRDEMRVLSLAEQAQRAGFHAWRPWVTLNPINDGGYWEGWSVGPWRTSEYQQRMERFAEMCGNLGLAIRLSFGDLHGTTREQRTELYEMWADIIAQRRGAFMMAEGLNEARDCGVSDPHEIERLVNILRARVPDLCCELSSYTGHEDVELLKQWTPSWQKHILVHGYRDGHVTDKCRHAWNLGYEMARSVRDDLRLVNHGEPAGPGPLVSVTANKHELDDPEAMHLFLASMKVGRGIPTYFCSAGVKSRGDDFANYAGFASVCEVLSHIPNEVSSWSLVHGGDNNRGKRIYPAPEGGRADHALSSNGQFAVVIHGGRWDSVEPERSVRIEYSHTCGSWGKIVVGRY